MLLTGKDGSTRQLSIAGTTVTDTVIYDVWGNVVNRTGTAAARLLWIGQLGYYFDPETGLLSVRERPYGPVAARWKAPDPLEFTNGLNLYRYVGNNPISKVDPSGLIKSQVRDAGVLCNARGI